MVNYSAEGGESVSTRSAAPAARPADERDVAVVAVSPRAPRGAKHRARGRSRRELPAQAVSTLKAWLVSAEHFKHPYPTAGEQAMLMQTTGIDKKQLKNWFTNARRRIWKPLVRRKLTGNAEPTNEGANVPETEPTPPPVKTESYETQSTSCDSPREAPDKPREAPSAPRSCMKHVESGSFLDALIDDAHMPSADDCLDGKLTPSDGAYGDDVSSSSQACDDDRPLAVHVARARLCSFCAFAAVDTQLMPCTHLFHGSCLRPWLEATVTTPSCPVCAIAISNCVHAKNYDLV